MINFDNWDEYDYHNNLIYNIKSLSYNYILIYVKKSSLIEFCNFIKNNFELNYFLYVPNMVNIKNCHCRYNQNLFFYIKKRKIKYELYYHKPPSLSPMTQKKYYLFHNKKWKKL